MALSKETRIIIMLGIDTIFFFTELVVGLIVGSLALEADAFHMLNDIISLAVGWWAVRASKRSSTDKYSYGWLRAEILGAAFNAIFLIALCFTILLDAIERLANPTEVSNPVLVLIVGSVGLASNLIGFLVLGGHGHSHGPEEHDHGDEVSAAEEGHSHGPERHDIVHDHPHQHEGEGVGHVFPEAVIAKAKSSARIRFKPTEEEQITTKDSGSVSRSLSKSTSPKKHRRRTSGYFNNIDDLSIHPASLRQEILAASRPRLDGTDTEDDNDEEEEAAVVDEDEPTENSPLLTKTNGESNGSSNGHQHKHHDHKPRHDSWHANHNHNKPRKASKGGHSHSHADMGMNAMILHVIGDALGNVGVIVSALIIWLTTWEGRFYADPAVSIFITIIILKTAFPLTAAATKILLQATPDHIDVNEIKEDIENIPGVVSCHHVHIWQLTDIQIVASMHIQVAFPISEAAGERYMEVARATRNCLHAYGIHSVTIQPEFCLDKDHDHAENSIIGLDGIVGQGRCRMDDDECLLECVDNCKGKGCCPAPATDSQHDHSDHNGHPHSH